MSDVFISYSRRDRPFVEQLRAAFEAAKRSVWVDLRDIPPSADWRDEIHQAIDGSDALVCVLSPDYVASPICREEVEYAVASNKRLIPVVCRDVTGHDAPPALAALNWIFFRDSDDWQQALGRLLSALDTDLPYVRSGTRLLVRAKEWETKGRNASFTLRGKDLAEAEQWLASSGGKQPPPSQEQTQYIVFSRRASSRRQRTTIGALTVGILITLTLSIISTTLYKVTNDQNIVLRGHDIAGKANDALANNHLDQGLLLAVAASKQHDDIDTRNALLNGLDSASYLSAVLIGAQPSEGSANDFSSVAYSRDGKTLMAIDHATSDVYLWDGVTHQLRLRFHVPQTTLTSATGAPFADPLTSAAISPDGQFVATKSLFSGIRIWDTATGALKLDLANRSNGHNTGDNTITKDDIVFSLDGNLLAWSECADTLCQSEQVILWNTRTGAFLPTVPISGTSPLGLSLMLAFSHDSNELAVGVLYNIRYLNKQLGGLVDVFTLDANDTAATLTESISLGDGTTHEQSGDVRAIAFSPDDSLLAVAGRQGVVFWDFAQRQFQGVPLFETDGTISAEAFSPDGRYLVTGTSGGVYGVRIWSVGLRFAVTPVLKAHDDAITSIAFSPDDRQFASSGIDGQVLLWRLAPYSPLSILPGNGYLGYGQVAFSPDGSLIATSSDNGVTLWNVQSGEQVRTLVIPASDRGNSDDEVGGLAFSPDGKLLAAGDQQAQVILWNVSTGALVGLPLHGHQIVVPGTAYNLVMDLAFSPNGAQLVSSALDGRAILWDVKSLTAIQVFTGIGARERQAAFSPDGRYVAVTGSGQDITIWDETSQSVVRTISTRGVWVRAVAFYPHHAGLLAALDTSGAITTWNVSTGTEVGQPLSDGKLATSLASPHLLFNAAGTQLISSHDLTLSIWDVSQPGQGQRYVRAIVPNFSLNNAILSPDGRYLAIATLGDIEVRYATVAGWRFSACSIANRELTQSEWQQFIPNTPYQAVC